MINRVWGVILFVTFVLLFSYCRKHEETEKMPAVEKGALVMGITHSVDEEIISFDSVFYQNINGFRYNISRLQYYLSSVSLTKDNGERYIADSIFYIDAKQTNPIIQLSGIPAGYYTQLSFCIGIKEANNKSGGLPATGENLNMAWPDAMGGGYHFLKLEGHFLDSQSNESGYAVHLGTNPMLVSHIPVKCFISVAGGKTATINLDMNVNEWFTNPYNYDFIKDGNYTMSDNELMKLISNNGKDVFKLR